MADKKISQLTAATLPFAGTEVLPIVQSSTTLKVSVNDLAAGNLKSQSTTGVLQVSGPGASTTRVMTVPNANFTAARTDAAQSFTGDQTLSTGNLIQGTAAKGVNFTANTGAAGMTSQLLNWYEEGTWTPALKFDNGMTGSFTYTTQSGTYTRIGRLITARFNLAWSAIPSAGIIMVMDLPFTAVTAANVQGFISDQGGITNTGTYAITGGDGLVVASYVPTQCSIATVKSGAAYADPLQKSALTSASGQLKGVIIYEVA